MIVEDSHVQDLILSNQVQLKHRQSIKENPDFTDENQFFEQKFKQKNYPLKKCNKIIDNNLQMEA